MPTALSAIRIDCPHLHLMAHFNHDILIIIQKDLGGIDLPHKNYHGTNSEFKV